MTQDNGKPKVAFYWAASCGGCEITITELGMNLVAVGDAVDIVFWPCAMDFKYSDVEAMDDAEIDVCFFNGAIRTSENEHLAKLLRRKSKVLGFQVWPIIMTANRFSSVSMIPSLLLMIRQKRDLQFQLRCLKAR